MGGITPTLTTFMQLLPVVQQGFDLVTNVSRTQNTYQNNERSRQTALQQLEQKQSNEIRQKEEDAALERSKIDAEAAEAKRKRDDALRRSVARQRARFGASGTGSSSGSSQAVLLGLVNETEEERLERERLDSLKKNALDQDIEQQRRTNVLERTQLLEKQDLNRKADRHIRERNLTDSALEAAGLAGRLF